MDKPSIRAGSRILLLEGGSLDKVRTWDGEGEWENRVSSLTAENVAWLDSRLFHDIGATAADTQVLGYGSISNMIARAPSMR